MLSWVVVVIADVVVIDLQSFTVLRSLNCPLTTNILVVVDVFNYYSS